MFKAINFSDFCDSFESIRPDNFSYDGLRVLFDYFDAEYDNVELDVIAICCEFNEASADEIIEDYGLDGFREKNGRFDDWRVYGDRENEKIMDYLHENSIVIGECNNGNIVYMAF
jgi:UDP-N-acetylglucosamine transferase subunit ALG13